MCLRVATGAKAGCRWALCDQSSSDGPFGLLYKLVPKSIPKICGPKPGPRIGTDGHTELGWNGLLNTKLKFNQMVELNFLHI